MEKYTANLRIVNDEGQLTAIPEMGKPVSLRDAHSGLDYVQRFHGYVLLGKERKNQTVALPTFFSTEGLTLDEAVKTANKLNPSYRDSNEYSVDAQGNAIALFACYKVYVRVDPDFIREALDRQVIVSAVEKLRQAGLSEADIELFIQTVRTNALTFEHIKSYDEQKQQDIIEPNYTAEAVDEPDDDEDDEDEEEREDMRPMEFDYSDPNTWTTRLGHLLEWCDQPATADRTRRFFADFLSAFELTNTGAPIKSVARVYENRDTAITNFIMSNLKWTRFVTSLTHTFPKHEGKLKIMYPLFNNMEDNKIPSLAEVIVRTWDVINGTPS